MLMDAIVLGFLDDLYGPYIHMLSPYRSDQLTVRLVVSE